MSSTSTWMTGSTVGMVDPDSRQFKDYYEKQQLIGRGAFGEALTVKRRSDRAILIMKKERILPINKRKIKEEVNALKKCFHKNIVEYVDDIIDEKYSRIIMEYCSEGDLGDFIRNQQGNLLSSQMVVFWALEIVAGLAYLKKQRIVHRDLV